MSPFLPDHLTQSPQSSPASSPQDTIPPELSLLTDPLNKFLTAYIDTDADIEKTQQIGMLRKVYQYWNGNQYLLPQFSGDNAIDYLPLTSFAPQLAASPTSARRGIYDMAVNFIQGDGLKYCAVLSPRAPNAHARPDDPSSDQAADKARKVDSLLTQLRAWWSVDLLQLEIARQFWCEGGAWLYTPAITDGDRFGHYTIPTYENKEITTRPSGLLCPNCSSFNPDQLSPACPNCGLPLSLSNLTPPITQISPVVTGEEPYARTGVDCKLRSFLNVTTPFDCQRIEDLPWLWCSEDLPKSELIRVFPWLAKTMRNDGRSGSTSIESQQELARGAEATPSGTYIPPREHRWKFTNYWLTPGQYYLLLEDRFNPTNPGAITTHLITHYPHGLRISKVNDVIVRVTDERLQDVWSYTKAGVSPFLYPHPVCWPYLAIQDQVNDVVNLFVETIERNIPFMLADPSVLDPRALQDKPPIPGEFLFVLPGTGQRLQDAIRNSPVATIEPKIVEFIQTLIGWAREIVGILPSIFGGQAANTQTAREAEMNRNQALQQLNIYWNNMRTLWKQTWLNGVRQLVRNNVEDPDPLLQELFSPNGQPLDWHIEVEEAIPQTWGQWRDFFMFLLDKPPQAWDLVGVTNPPNLEKMYDALGIPDWNLKGSNATRRIKDIIRKLLNAQPTQSPDPLTGQLSPQSPIPPDTVLFDPGMVVDTVREWLLSDDAAKFQSTKPTGYQCVVLYLQANLNILQQQQMAQAQAQQSPSQAGAAPPGGPPPPAGGPPTPLGPASGDPPPPPPPSAQIPLPPEEQNVPQITS